MAFTCAFFERPTVSLSFQVCLDPPLFASSPSIVDSHSWANFMPFCMLSFQSQDFPVSILKAVHVAEIQPLFCSAMCCGMGLHPPRGDSRGETVPSPSQGPGPAVICKRGCFFLTCMKVLDGLEVILSIWLEFSILS